MAVRCRPPGTPPAALCCDQLEFVPAGKLRHTPLSGRFYALLIVKVVTIIGGEMLTSETLMDDGNKPLRRKVAGCKGLAAFRSVVYAKTVVFDNMQRNCFFTLAPKMQKILTIHTAVTFAALHVGGNDVFRHKNILS